MKRRLSKGWHQIIKKICSRSLVFVFLLLSTSVTAEQLQADLEKPWDERTWEEKVYQSRYEDRYTFKHGKPYILDPWTWSYTKEFAERFRMPEQWIESELKGALAVAWRMTTIGDTTCGLGKKEDNCWKPLNCQLDVYYDNKIELPWVRPEVVLDNRMQGLSSSRFLEIPPKTWPPEKQAGLRSGGGLNMVSTTKVAAFWLVMIKNFNQVSVLLVGWEMEYVRPEIVAQKK